MIEWIIIASAFSTVIVIGAGIHAGLAALQVAGDAADPAPQSRRNWTEVAATIMALPVIYVMAPKLINCQVSASMADASRLWFYACVTGVVLIAVIGHKLGWNNSGVVQWRSWVSLLLVLMLALLAGAAYSGRQAFMCSLEGTTAPSVGARKVIHAQGASTTGSVGRAVGTFGRQTVQIIERIPALAVPSERADALSVMRSSALEIGASMSSTGAMIAGGLVLALIALTRWPLTNWMRAKLWRKLVMIPFVVVATLTTLPYVYGLVAAHLASITAPSIALEMWGVAVVLGMLTTLWLSYVAVFSRAINIANASSRCLAAHPPHEERHRDGGSSLSS